MSLFGGRDRLDAKPLVIEWRALLAPQASGKGRAETPSNPVRQVSTTPTSCRNLLQRRELAVCANMYGPAARCKTDFQDDEREVLHQCIRPGMWSILLVASMGIRAHPRLTKR